MRLCDSHDNGFYEKYANGLCIGTFAIIPTRRQVTGSKHLCLDYVILCLPYYLNFMWYTVSTDSCYQKVITATVITGIYELLFRGSEWLLTL